MPSNIPGNFSIVSSIPEGKHSRSSGFTSTVRQLRLNRGQTVATVYDGSLKAAYAAANYANKIMAIEGMAGYRAVARTAENGNVCIYIRRS